MMRLDVTGYTTAGGKFCCTDAAFKVPSVFMDDFDVLIQTASLRKLGIAQLTFKCLFLKVNLTHVTVQLFLPVELLIADVTAEILLVFVH